MGYLEIFRSNSDFHLFIPWIISERSWRNGVPATKQIVTLNFVYNSVYVLQKFGAQILLKFSQ